MVGLLGAGSAPYSLAMLARIPDRLVLKPTTNPLPAEDAKKQQLDTPVGPCTLWTRSPQRKPDLLLIRIPGAGGRAERAVERPLDLWADLAIETWAVNPPGFGDSPGPARLSNIYPCTHALLTAARETGLPTMVAGNSLGGLAALLAAPAFDLAGLIVRNPPALRAVIRSRRAWWNGWLGAYLIAAMVPRQVEPHGALAEAKTPAIFIRSLDDRVVPAHLQQQLIDRYAAPKQQIDLPGADHDAPLEADQQAVFRTQLDWLRARFTR